MLSGSVLSEDLKLKCKVSKVLSPIVICSFPIKVTVCSIILPEIALIWAFARVISWFHHVPTIKSFLALPLYEVPSIIRLSSVLSTLIFTYLSFLFCFVFEENLKNLLSLYTSSLAA